MSDAAPKTWREFISSLRSLRPKDSPKPPGSQGAPRSPRQGYFPIYVWVMALLSGLIALWAYQRIGQPDDLASLWIAGEIVHYRQLDHLYSIDRIDFARHTGDIWYHHQGKIEDLAPHAHPFVQLPLVAWVMAPLTQITDFATFASYFAFLSGVAVTLIAASAISLWTRRAAKPMELVLAAGGLGLSGATYMALNLGQTTPLIVALIAGSLAFSIRRPLLAGISLAIASLIKLTPIILIVGMLLFASRRLTGIVAAATTIAGFMASWALAGHDLMQEFIEVAVWMNTKTLFSPANGSFDALFSGQVYNPRNGVMVLDETSPWAFLAKLTLLLIVAVGLLLVVAVRSDWTFEIGAVAVLTTTTALAGVVWVHYSMFAILPLAGVLLHYREKAWPEAIAIMLLLMPLGESYYDEKHTPLALAWAPMVGLLIPTIFLVWRKALSKPVTVQDFLTGLQEEILGVRLSSARASHSSGPRRRTPTNAQPGKRRAEERQPPRQQVVQQGRTAQPPRAQAPRAQQARAQQARMQQMRAQQERIQEERQRFSHEEHSPRPVSRPTPRRIPLNNDEALRRQAPRPRPQQRRRPRPEAHPERWDTYDRPRRREATPRREPAESLPTRNPISERIARVTEDIPPGGRHQRGE